MSLSPSVIDAMIAAGCTAEQLGAAYKASCVARVSYVYIIRPFHGLRPVKVGMAYNPWYRITELQTGSPVPLHLHNAFPVKSREDAQSLEREFHEAFAADRLHGEWFEVDADTAEEWLRLEIGHE